MKKIFLAVAVIVAMTAPVSAQPNEVAPPVALQVDKLEMQPVYDRPWTRRGQAYWGVVVNCRQWITLRDEPSVYGADLAHVPLGAEVMVYDGPPQNGFYAVKYNGINGFVLAEYIRNTNRAA